MTGCPTDSQIERYAAGELSASEVEEIDRLGQALEQVKGVFRRR